jgi:hypothetical protein
MLLSSPSCTVFQPPVTSSLLGPNILLNTLFLNSLSLCSSLNQTPSFTPMQNQRQNFNFVRSNFCVLTLKTLLYEGSNGINPLLTEFVMQVTDFVT